MTPSTRRSVLALIGSGLAGLAGCSGQSRERAVPVPEKVTNPPTDAPSTPDPTPKSTDTERPTPDHETLRWWFDVGDDGSVAPAVADGTVYVGSSAPVRSKPGTPSGPPHRLFALDLADGSEQWAFETGPPVDATPIVRDGIVYVVSGVDFGLGGRNYRIDAVDATTGAREWQFAPENVSYLNLLAIANGTVVLGSNDDEIVPGGNEYAYALDAETGEQRWRTQYGDVLLGSSTGPIVYLPAPDGLYAVDSRDGEEMWHFESDSLFAPEVLGDTLLVDVHPFTALDATTGDVIWRLQGDGRGLGEWDASSGGIFGTVGDETVVGIDTDDGSERWQVQFPGRPRLVSAWRDRVIVGDRAGTIVEFDGKTGAPRWQHESDEITDVNEIAVGEERIYVTYGERTGIAALDAEHGSLRWQFAPGGELTSPVRADDLVLVGSSNGYLYALDS